MPGKHTRFGVPHKQQHDTRITYNRFVPSNLQILPIISLLNANPPWPCSSKSLSELLELSQNSTEAIRSVETMFCMNDEIQEEWKKYLATKNFNKPVSFICSFSSLNLLDCR